jgi:Ca2+/Na+ antiporter
MPAPQPRPLTVVGAALVQALQAAVVLFAAVLAGIDASQGRSYQNASGIAITVIGIGTGVALALVALGLARAKRWSRTPALMTQLFCGIIGIYLVQGQRYWWGVPMLTLSAAGFVLLLVPPSIRALTADPADQQAG